MNEIFLEIPRLHTAIAEWLFCVVVILFLKKRFKGVLHYTLLFVWLGVFIGFHHIAGNMPIGLWIPFMLMAILLMFMFVFHMTKTSYLTVGFISLQAFIVAEFAASFEWQFYYYFLLNLELANPVVLEYVIMVLIYALVVAIIIVLESRYKARNFQVNTSRSDLFTAIGITSIIFFMSNLSFMDINTPITGRYPTEVFYIRTLIDLLGIILFYLIREYNFATHTRTELREMESLLVKQYAQYRSSQESIDLVNKRYHDLKHQITVIRSEQDHELRNKYLDELEHDINVYEVYYKTGNKVLDTILTSKGLELRDKKINFTCVADGSLIDFISVMDICSIFGNALDNAIESVSEIDDLEKRLIKLAVFKQQNLLLIKIENYYMSELRYDGGHLLTTKKDKKMHGYGLKSIRSTVDRYDGTIRINTDNNWFTLLILIPIIKTEGQVMTEND